MLSVLLALGFLIVVGLACLASFFDKWYSFCLAHIKVWSMIFTSSMKFLSSVYLSFAPQSNVGCFMMGPLILGPLFSALAVPAADMTWITTLVASATACVMYSLIFVCLLAILFLALTGFCGLFLSVPLRHCLLPILSLPNISCFSLPLWDFLLLTSCNISCLIEDDTDVLLQ